MSKHTNGVIHKGYVLLQHPEYYDYVIFEESTGKWVCHSQCTVLLSEEEKKEHIENFLKFREKRGVDF